MKLSIRRATKEDLPAVVSLFDETVIWLSKIGLEGQWGTQPFSHNPQMTKCFEAWTRAGSMYIAEKCNLVLGALVLSDRPPEYVAGSTNENSPDALYLEAFVTQRRLAGKGLGGRLLSWAERLAIERGFNWLQLDCWAGNEALRRYYRRAGFDELEEFDVRSWRGVLFEKPVRL